MSVSICIQDSGYSKSFSLHEALEVAGKDAVLAGGAYAFVSKGGVDLLSGSPWFGKVLAKGGVQLVVGMDAITDVLALDALSNISEVSEKFKVQAFLQSAAGAIFHPKMFWFENANGGVVITGSGNLTVGGMRRNKEIFSVNHVSAQQISDIRNSWIAWLDENNENLFGVNTDVVRARAERNKVDRTRLLEEGGAAVVLREEPLVYDVAVPIEQGVDVEDWKFDNEAAVLVAQIPRSKDRWSQANFSLSMFESFFGGVRGDNSRRLVLRDISDDNALGDLEDRPCVTVKSKNFRLEIAAASGLDYPDEGRPIGIFVRVSVRMFLYYLCMPGCDSYKFVDEWLTESWRGPKREMKRVETDFETFRSVLERTPLISMKA